MMAAGCRWQREMQSGGSSSSSSSSSSDAAGNNNKKSGLYAIKSTVVGGWEDASPGHSDVRCGGAWPMETGQVQSTCCPPRPSALIRGSRTILPSSSLMTAALLFHCMYLYEVRSGVELL